MNRTNFVQTGGFPVKSERLQELQEAYSIFNDLGYLAGNYAILNGCVVTGSNVSDGVVVMNGEVIAFQGGTLASDVIIVETAISKDFKDGSVKPLHYVRVATFGTSVTSVLWSAFKRVDPILTLMTRLSSLEKKTAVFQAGGGMVLWNKPAVDIPTGWAEVVDWRGRIPVGMDFADSNFNLLGKTGGGKNVTLVANNIPQLNTDAIKLSGTNSAFGIKTGTDTWVNAAKANPGATAQSFSILNPYRTVLFIEFIG